MRRAVSKTPFLSVVVPVFNEAARITSSLASIVGFLDRQRFPWEVVVADDGSSDDSATLVESFGGAAGPLRIVRLPHHGKGSAIRAAMLHARGQYRYMCDADLATPIEEVLRFLPPLLTGYDIAIGSREAPGARRFGEPAHRHWMGRAFNLVVRAMAVPGIHDTQCGFKCFRGPVADELFPLQRVTGFGFDVEILYLAQRRGMVIREVPVPWHYRQGSKVHPLRDSVRMFGDVVHVRWNALRGHYPSREGDVRVRRSWSRLGPGDREEDASRPGGSRRPPRSTPPAQAR